MSTIVWAKEAEGRTVRDPVSLVRLTEPAKVDRDDPYWFRRFADADLVECPPPAYAVEQPDPAPAEASTTRPRRGNDA